MIWSGQRRPRAWVQVAVGVAAIGVVAAGCQVNPLDSSAGADAGSGWDPQSLPPLAVSGSGGGAKPPSYPGVVVSESQGLSVSTGPMLKVAAAPGGQQYEFTVKTVGNPGKVVWSGQASGNQVQLNPGTLEQGNVYQWSAKQVSGAGQVFGPFVMSVDTDRSGPQPSQSLGPFGVALATGAMSFGMPLRSVAGASGGLGASLLFQQGDKPSPGLPAGWSLRPSGQGWDHLKVLDGGSVSLVMASGMSVAYAPSSDGGAWAPVPVAGRPVMASDWPTLAKNVDGTWTATAPTGAITSFGQADSGGTAAVTGTWQGTSAAPSFQYSQGKLTGVRDGISPELGVAFHYQGTDDCPDVPDGFTGYPQGFLCSVSYPDGSATWLFYVDGVAGGSQLARVVDHPETRDSKASVTDLGYDQAARVVLVRDSAAANAQASGRRTDSQALISTVSYDWRGRVQTVTKPAAAQGGPQPSYQVQYSGSGGQTTITANGPRTSTGYSIRYGWDTTTLNQLSSTDSKGHTAKQTWVPGTDKPATETEQYGRTTARAYDANGYQRSVTGPYNSAPDQTTPTVSYQWDQDLSGPKPKPLQGLATTYWANSEMTGTPAGTSAGPKIDGHVPQDATWNWPANPAGSGTQPWSARLTGTLTIPTTTTAKRAKAGAVPAPTGFGFQAPAGSHLWIDNMPCVDTCSLALAPGSHQVRADVAVAHPEGSGGAGVSIRWQPPGQGMAPIPATALAPGYGLQSVAKQNDATAAGSPTNPQLYTQFAEESQGKPTASWSKDMPAIKGTVDWEQFNPDQGLFGRKTKRTQPGGSSTTIAYYRPDESADVPCDGAGSVAQHGLTKSLTRDGQTYQNYYDNMGRLIATQIAGEATAGCTYYNDTGAPVMQVTPARGEQKALTVTTDYMVGGDPFTTTTTLQEDGGNTYTTSQTVDLYGNTTRATDVWGTTQTFTYDPYTGDTLTATTTLPGGKTTTTTTNTYNTDGDLTQIAIDGKTMATITPPAKQGSTITYGNGVKATISLDDIGRYANTAWTSADNKTFTHANQTSPTGRILTETLGFAGKPATWQYGYDKIGRLTSANLATSLPVAHKNFAYDFATNTQGTNPNAGLDSNRTSQTIDGVQTRYGYDTTGRLTTTTDPALPGGIGYSSRGEINQLGPVTINYDQASNTTKISDSKTGETTSYHRVAGTILDKTTTTTTGATTSRYAAGGYILDTNNNPQWRQLTLPGAVVQIPANPAGTQTWQYYTPRGQLMWQSDQTGKDAGTRKLYSPFGEDLTTSPPPPANGGVPAPNLQWQTGHEQETIHAGGIPLIPMGARLYVPQLGRFTSPDPKDGGSANPYDYTNQDPINNTDPNGTMSYALSTLVDIVGFALSVVITRGLTAAVEATAVARTFPVLYQAAAALVAGTVSLGVSEAENAISGDKGTFTDVMTAVSALGSMYLGAYMARGAQALGGMTEAVTATGRQFEAATERLGSRAEAAYNETRTAVNATVSGAARGIVDGLDTTRAAVTRAGATATRAGIGGVVGYGVAAIVYPPGAVLAAGAGAAAGYLGDAASLAAARDWVAATWSGLRDSTAYYVRGAGYLLRSLW